MNFFKLKNLEIFNVKSKSCFLIVITLIFFNLQSLVLVAEEKKNTENSNSNLVQINYYQGKLEQEYLPYYKQFAIVGSTKLPNFDADAVMLEIKWIPPGVRKSLKKQERRIKKKPISGQAKKAQIKKLHENNKKIYETVPPWIRGKDDKTSTFKLIVSPLTGWKQNYDLIFTFFDKPNEDNKFVLQIVKKTLEELGNIFDDKKEISNTDAGNILQSALDTEIKKVEGKSDFYYFESKDGKPKLIKKFPEFKFTDNTDILDKIAGVTVSEKQLKDEKKKLVVLKSELDKVKSSDLNALIKDLKESLIDAIKQGIVTKFPYGYSDIALLKSLKKKPENVPEGFVKKFEDVLVGDKWIIFKSLLPKSKTSLIVILNTFRQVNSINEIEKELKANKSQVEGDLKKMLMNFYIKHLRISTDKRSFTSNKTELDRIRFGTIYGIGGALLSAGKDPEFNSFSYIAVRYYFGPVDRRRANPFLRKGSRFSFNIGAVFSSEITYKGQKQEDVFSNIMPMFGFGYEISSIFSVNIGTIIHYQPSINPLSTKKDFKLAFYMGISYDFDLFNKLKDLFNPSNKN